MGVIFTYLEKSWIEKSHFQLINLIHYLLLQVTQIASKKEGKIFVLTASSWRWWKGGEMFTLQKDGTQPGSFGRVKVQQ